MDYQKTLEDIESRRRELVFRNGELLHQRERLDKELAKVEGEIQGLDRMRVATELAAGHPHAPLPRAPGLSEHIRKVLSETRLPLTAMEIRDSCEKVGIKASSKRNLLMAVYTTLRRMNSEVRTSRQNGRLAFFPSVWFQADPVLRRRRNSKRRHQ